MIYPVILCGGQGTRLWPISNEELPKQFIDFNNKYSLLQNTLNRIKGLKNLGVIYIVTHHNQRFIVEKQIDDIGIKSAEIILEPVGKNTAPAITLAAIHISRYDPQAKILILSTDSEIKQTDSFEKLINQLTDRTLLNNRLILLGVIPKYPEIGYGYVKSGDVIKNISNEISVCKVDHFIEKPNLKQCKKMIDDGYLWNSGIFLFPLELFVNEIQIYAPKIHDACDQALIKSHRHKSGDSNFFINYIDHKEFEHCPTDSIDYALIEKTNCAAVINTNMEWSDIGSWSNVYESQKKDLNGNVIKANSCISINNKNVQIYSSDNARTIAAVNLSNLTIIDSKNAVLVLNTSYSQNVKKVVNKITSRSKFENRFYDIVHTCWGSVETIIKQGQFTIKKIVVNFNNEYDDKNTRKSKLLMVLKGRPILLINGTGNQYSPNQSVIISPGSSYKIINCEKVMDTILLKVEF